MNHTALRLENLVGSSRERLLAVEPQFDGGVVLYCRSQAGAVEKEFVDYAPFVLVSGEELANSLEGAGDIIPLEGSGTLRFRVHFPNRKAYDAGLKQLKALTGENPSSPLAPYRVFNDLTQQFLTLFPARLFRGMEFKELHRLQLDIETLTTPGYDFPNATREGDSICMISMCDSSGWECLLSAREMTEAAMLREMVRIIRDRDPDVIEGHNIFQFDLPYLEARCKRCKVKFNLGRENARVWTQPSRFSAGERTVSYKRYNIPGRHVVDTLHLVQLYDVSHRELESYGLKSVAQHFGVAAPERTYVEGSDISRMFAEEPEVLAEYALDDVRETEAIARLLSPSYFHQAQLIPMSYQNCITRGNATRIDALLCAEYLVADAALPTPQAPRSFQGGLTGSINTGVFRNVWHADVRSLYPSIIISQGLTPCVDDRGVYHSLLAGLRQFRLEAKDAAREAEGERREHFNALQSSFKVLINSFYGYAGFGQGTFNDFDLAEKVTSEGRRILQSMLDYLNSEGATVIEMDTDGIYFVPPQGVTETEEMAAGIQTILPDGIDIDLDATYAAMLGYKAKNYALLSHDGTVSFTGAALKSRGLEPFQRDYIREVITLLLLGKGGEEEALYERYVEAIENRTLPVASFAKREVLSSSPVAYRDKLAAGKTRRSAAYELALGSGREYRQGDQIVFYVTGDKKSVAVSDAAKLLSEANPESRDENLPYYLDKLKKLRLKFADFLDF